MQHFQIPVLNRKWEQVSSQFLWTISVPIWALIQCPFVTAKQTHWPRLLLLSNPAAPLLQIPVSITQQERTTSWLKVTECPSSCPARCTFCQWSTDNLAFTCHCRLDKTIAPFSLMWQDMPSGNWIAFYTSSSVTINYPTKTLLWVTQRTKGNKAVRLEILEPGKTWLYVTVGSVMLLWNSMLFTWILCVFFQKN